MNTLTLPELLAAVEDAAPAPLRPMIGEVCAYLLNVVYAGEQVQVWPLDGDLYSEGRWAVAPKLDGLTPLYIGAGLSDALLFCHVYDLNCEVNQTPTTTLDNCKRWRRWYDSPAVWRPGQEATGE